MLANPYVILAIVLGLIASHGAVGYKAYHAGENAIVAEQAKEASIEERTRNVALQVTSEAISKIEVRNVTVRQKAETITRERVVYSECQHDPDGLCLVNEARRDAPEPPAGNKLPAAGPAH
jgi:hypothetical protein